MINRKLVACDNPSPPHASRMRVSTCTPSRAVCCERGAAGLVAASFPLVCHFAWLWLCGCSVGLRSERCVKNEELSQPHIYLNLPKPQHRKNQNITPRSRDSRLSRSR